MMRRALFGVGIVSVLAVACAAPIESEEGEVSDSAIRIDNGGTQRRGMHACGVGSVVAGAKFSTNQFACDSAFIYRQQDEQIDDWGGRAGWADLWGTWDGWMDCPEKMAVTGIHQGNRKLTCVRAGTIEGAGSTRRSVSGVSSCPDGAFVTGINAISNKLHCSRRVQKCFGFEGDECALNPGADEPSGSNRQHISGGSLEHDLCCFVRPSGDGCINGPFADGDDDCADSWKKAQDRYWGGIKWHRTRSTTKKTLFGSSYPKASSILPERRSTTTAIDDVCAPHGSIVHTDDLKYCCSGHGLRLMPSDLTTTTYTRADNIGIIDKGKVEALVRSGGDISVCATPLPVADP